MSSKLLAIMAPQTLPKPYWYMLLDYRINIGDNSGLSLPFLIGVKGLFERIAELKDRFSDAKLPN